jgi:HEAT repeat protein
VEALGRLAVPSTLPVLLELLDDQNAAIRARAIAAVAGFPPSPLLYERLRPFLDTADGSLEAEAAIALARLKDLSSEGRITTLLASPHASTRQAAATALSLLPLEFVFFTATTGTK